MDFTSFFDFLAAGTLIGVIARWILDMQVELHTAVAIGCGALIAYQIGMEPLITLRSMGDTLHQLTGVILLSGMAVALFRTTAGRR